MFGVGGRAWILDSMVYDDVTRLASLPQIISTQLSVMQELAKACHSGSSVEHPALALKAQTNLCKTLLPTLLGLLRLVKAECITERQNR